MEDILFELENWRANYQMGRRYYTVQPSKMIDGEYIIDLHIDVVLRTNINEYPINSTMRFYTYNVQAEGNPNGNLVRLSEALTNLEREHLAAFNNLELVLQDSHRL